MLLVKDTLLLNKRELYSIPNCSTQNEQFLSIDRELHYRKRISVSYEDIHTFRTSACLFFQFVIKLKIKLQFTYGRFIILFALGADLVTEIQW